MVDFKSEKAVTLAVLITTVIILLIVSSIAIYSVKSSKNVAPYNKMVADVELLHDKILDYYNKNGVIPKKDETQVLIDNVTYYEIDLEKLENITLNYGLKKNSSDDVYLVDNKLNIYYKEGVELDGQIYHVKINTQVAEESNDTNWILIYFANNGLLEDGKDISDETLNKINSLARGFTSYNANGQTYNLSKEDVLSFLIVFYDLNDQEIILYRYDPIFWSTHTYGEGEESFNRRAAIINYLNDQEEITGMLRGDLDGNAKLGNNDYTYMQSFNAYAYEWESAIPKQDEYDDDFKYYYFSILGDMNNDGSTDVSDLTVLNYYINNIITDSIFEEMTAKYYIESDDTYWMEEGLLYY